ncbi:unnamed protein product, partial [Allacma fusca]
LGIKRTDRERILTDGNQIKSNLNLPELKESYSRSLHPFKTWTTV